MSTVGGGGSVLVVDVGTSGVRASIVRPDAGVTHAHHAPVLPESPAPGLVEFDAVLMAEAVMQVAQATLAEGGPVEAVGIANQRASTIVWDRATGEPVAPGIGWQDLRTVGTCLVLQGEGIRLAPNASATKLMAILDAVDPDRTRASAGELCFGTVDTWVAWILSGGAVGGQRRAARHRRHQRRGDRHGRRLEYHVGPAVARTTGHPDGAAAPHRRLVGGRGRLPRPSRLPDHLRDGR